MTRWLLLLTVLVPQWCVAQGIYGLKQNVLDPFSEGLLLARFDMATGEWAEYDTLGFAEAFALGTSTFDNVSGQYVFVGAPLGEALEWYNYDVEGNQLSASVPCRKCPQRTVAAGPLLRPARLSG